MYPAFYQSPLSYTPVNVNPDPHPGTWSFGGTLSRYWQLFESPVHGGFAHFVALFLKNVGIIRGFVLIQDGRDSFLQGLPGTFWHIGADTSVHRYLWNPFIVIQINTSINLGHGFKKANALILRCR